MRVQYKYKPGYGKPVVVVDRPVKPKKEKEPLKVLQIDPQREQALVTYYQNPNICKTCKQPIEVKPHEKVADVRQRSYCSQVCHGNSKKGFPYQCRKKKGTYYCGCGKERVVSRKFCPDCWIKKQAEFGEFTKADVSGSQLRSNARVVLFRHKPECCQVCGYDNFVEAAHIKPVKSFPNTAKVNEINAIDNLMALCPNHHAEFDHPNKSKRKRKVTYDGQSPTT